MQISVFSTTNPFLNNWLLCLLTKREVMVCINSSIVIKKEFSLLNLAISHYQRITIIIILTAWLIWITLYIDIMHMNKVSFLVSKAYYLNYYQCVPICKKGKEYILTAIEQMCNKYNQRGIFRVTQIEGNRAFECARTELQFGWFGNICLITCDTQKHVPRIESGIRTLKDHIRSTQMLM